MVFTSLPHVLLRILITLIVLGLGLVFLRVAMFYPSLVLWVGAAFLCFGYEEFAYPISHLFCLNLCAILIAYL